MALQACSFSGWNSTRDGSVAAKKSQTIGDRKSEKQQVYLPAHTKPSTRQDSLRKFWVSSASPQHTAIYFSDDVTV